MQNANKITVYAKIHKNLKPEDVEGVFSLPGTTFEVKEDNVFATKEVSSPKEEWEFMVEAEKHIYEKQESLIVASFEKMLAQEREENTVVGDIENIENSVDDTVEENKEEFVGETKEESVGETKTGDTENMMRITRTLENNHWNYKPETLEYAEKDFYINAKHKHVHFEVKIEMNDSVTEAVITGNRLIYTYKLVGFEGVENARERAFQQINHHFFELGFLPTVVSWEINEIVLAEYYKKKSEEQSKIKYEPGVKVSDDFSVEQLDGLSYEGVTFDLVEGRIVSNFSKEGMSKRQIRMKDRAVCMYIREELNL